MFIYVRAQDNHSGGRKRPKTVEKRRFTAVICTLFHRNPSFQITATVSGRLMIYKSPLVLPNAPITDPKNNLNSEGKG
jgi:hypothetical protein